MVLDSNRRDALFREKTERMLQKVQFIIFLQSKDSKAFEILIRTSKESLM